MLMKVLSHPGHSNSKGYIKGNWTCFIVLIYSFSEISLLLKEIKQYIEPVNLGCVTHMHRQEE